MDRTDSSITMVRSQSLSRHHADPFHNDSLERCLKFIQKTKHPTRNQHIYIAIITTVIVVLYSQEKKLNDLIGSEEIDDETIDRWNDTCLSRLRTQLVRQAFQLPTIMELIKMNTTRTVNGKDVPIYTQRDKHMRPPVDVYRVTLTPALIQAYQETWIQTKLVEITNGMLNFSRPLRSIEENSNPHESTPERKGEALITYGPT